MNTRPKIKTADMVQYRRDYYAARKARGVCVYCGFPLAVERRALGRVACVPCSRLRD